MEVQVIAHVINQEQRDGMTIEGNKRIILGMHRTVHVRVRELPNELRERRASREFWKDIIDHGSKL
jgi:hypothetical protein